MTDHPELSGELTVERLAEIEAWAKAVDTLALDGSEICKLITAARKGLSAGWLPISEAPKDGTRILVYRRGARRRPKIGMDLWKVEDSKWPWKPCWYHSPDDEQPTHFQFLPESPK